jgi:Holliday junction resolvasome RuvABC endonuclease subunit
MNLRRPQAYGALTEVVSMIRSTVIDHDWFVPFSLVDPPTVKMAVGAKGNADKDGVMAAMKLIPEITALIDCSTLDEHSVDAIAVGYCALVRLRLNGLSQIEHVY